MEKLMQNMMKRFPMMIGMGFMIVIIALIIGAVNASNASAYYAVDKATRDASVELAQTRASIESLIVWLPYFKFLGLGMILSGITMALGVISIKLLELGREVMGSVPQSARVLLPSKPHCAMAMRMFMILGMLVLIVGFIVSLTVAGTASVVFSNPVVAIDAAQQGSVLLSGLQRVHAAEAWLEAFKFVGIASLFLGIINGLTTIIIALKYQSTAIPQVVDKLPATAPAAAD